MTNKDPRIASVLRFVLNTEGNPTIPQKNQVRLIRPMMKLRLLSARFIFTISLSIILFPQITTAELQNYSDFDTFSIYLENDGLANTDRDYTNGIKLTWSTPYRFDEKKTRMPRWSYPIMNRLPHARDFARQRSVSFSVGQNIYTPEDIEETELIEDDRPYAGILYLSFGFHSKKDRHKDTWEFGIGMVGPHSYAEDTQKMVHNLIGSKQAEGWDNQLSDELSAEIIYESQWRLTESQITRRFGYDFIPHVGARLGNVQIYVNAGAEFRLGWNLVRDFGTCPIRPGCETNSAFGDQAENTSTYRRRRGVHLFVAMDGRMVLRDIFLDGNTFHDSHSVDKKDYVADFMGGIGFVFKRFKTSYAYVFRTKQFDTQERAQVFGTFTFSFSF